jgi:hypothetical protein
MRDRTCKWCGSGRLLGKRAKGRLLAIVLSTVCAGCSSSPQASTPVAGADPMNSSVFAASCVYETRTWEHCGGGSPEGPWAAGCLDRACPPRLDDHYVEFADPLGGTCSTSDEYRNVFDVLGSCTSWMGQGEPLAPVAVLYAGHSFLYNEFDGSIDIDESQPKCGECMSQHCPASYAACYPQEVSPATGAFVFPPCDDLIRCLRDQSTFEDTAAQSACEQMYPNEVEAATTFATCALQECRDSCW